MEERTDDTQRRVVWGIRGRILLWFIAVLSAATIAAVLVTRQLLISAWTLGSTSPSCRKPRSSAVWPAGATR